MSEIHYMLGAKASNLFDPYQPIKENQKLVGRQCKALKKTDKVRSMLNNEGLVIAEAEDVAAWEKEKAAGFAKAKARKAEIEGRKAGVVIKQDNSEELKAKDAVIVELKAKVEGLEKDTDTEEMKAKQTELVDENIKFKAELETKNADLEAKDAEVLAEKSTVKDLKTKIEGMTTAQAKLVAENTKLKK